MKFTNERIVILYASQTGNAQDVAERIWRESKKYYFNSICQCMDEYDVTNLIQENCVVFVCSTTGLGEEPENMRKFWRFLLRKSLPVNSLQNLRYAVLGLGDSSYVKFNFVAKKLNKRLGQLGGRIIQELGLADDQHDLGYDMVADAWIDSLWIHLLKLYPLPNGVQPKILNSVDCRWKVSFYNPIEKKQFTSQSLFYSTRASSEFFINTLKNERVTNDAHFQDVRLIKFKTNGESYSPGDVLVLRPKNLPCQVEEFQKLLEANSVKVSFDTMVKVAESEQKMPVPEVLKSEVPFGRLCEEYFDLTALPRRYVFQVLANITDSPLEKEKCLEFTTSEGQEDKYNYVNRPRRNIVEVLQDFPHAAKNLSLETLFEILTPIKPREFSIASSFKKHVNEIHILVAVVKYKTKLKKERLGLCSNYLADLKEGDELSVWVKKGSFKFPQIDDNKKIIMVGPGTGIAPFRSFIHEYSTETKNLRNIMLFFGCRNKKMDFYCGDEFLELTKDKELKFHCAFSRDQEDKIYVQDKIRENGQAVWDFLKDQQSYIFIAGNAKQMPQEVRKAFLDVIEKQGDLTEQEAQQYLEQMEKSNRYQTECWS